MTDATDLAATLSEILRRLGDLEKAGQIQHSTVQIDGEAVAIPVGIGAGVAAGEAIPGLTASLEQARVEVEAAGQAADAAVAAAAQASADVAAAQQDIDAALADVDGRVSQASADASAASQRADAAKAAAEAADQAARDAAGVAASKGLTIFQVSAPTGARAVPENLWINTTNGANTPNRYDTATSKWVPITDKAATDAAAAAAAASSAASDAASVAAAAKTAASNASTAAANAQTTANGKNTITYRATPPTTDDVGTSVGDVWFIRSTATGILTGQYEWTGPTNGWQQRLVGDLLVANLDAGKLTAGYIASARIAADTIIASMLAADAVLARNIKAGEIIAGKLAVDSVVAANIVAATITGDKLLANTITAREIKAGTITADLLSADAINGKTITGATLRSAASGQRSEIVSNRINFYTSGNVLAGSMFGSTTVGAAGGAVRIGNDLYSALIGGSSLPTGGTTDIDAEAAQFRSLYTNNVYDRNTGKLSSMIETQWPTATAQTLPQKGSARAAPPQGTMLIRQIRYTTLSVASTGLGARVPFSPVFPNACLFMTATTIFGSGASPVINANDIDRTGFSPYFAGTGQTTVGIVYEAVGW